MNDKPFFFTADPLPPPWQQENTPKEEGQPDLKTGKYSHGIFVADPPVRADPELLSRLKAGTSIARKYNFNLEFMEVGQQVKIPHSIIKKTSLTTYVSKKQQQLNVKFKIFSDEVNENWYVVRIR